MDVLQEILHLNGEIESCLKEKRAEDLPSLLTLHKELYKRFFEEFAPENETDLAVVTLLYEKEKKIARLAEKYKKELLEERQKLVAQKQGLLSYEKSLRSK